MSFSAWLSSSRKAQSISQAVLASKLGVTQAQVSQWENGKAEPKPEHMAKLEKLLGKPSGSTTKAAPTKAARSQAPASEPPPSAEAPRSSKGKKGGASSQAVLGFEEKLWLAADKLRGSMDAERVQARGARALLPQVHLRRVRAAPSQELVEDDPENDPEDRDEYVSANVFWVPEARPLVRRSSRRQAARASAS
jgi:transcriptional regulator with XRE-family HTH domain